MPWFLPEPHVMFCGSLVRKHCCEVLWKFVSSERMWNYVSACHGVAHSWLTWFCIGQQLFFWTRERVDLSSAVKLNFIVKQHVCGLCFSIMHLLQLAVYKISVATQYVSYRFLTTEKLYVWVCCSYIFFHVDVASTPVCFAGKDPKIISDSLKSAAKSCSSSALNMCFYVFFYCLK